MESARGRGREGLFLSPMPDQLLVINPTAGSGIEIPPAMPAPVRVTNIALPSRGSGNIGMRSPRPKIKLFYDNAIVINSFTLLVIVPVLFKPARDEDLRWADMPAGYHDKRTIQEAWKIYTEG
jgi:hypothetical protein